MPGLRARLCIATSIGIVSGACCWFLLAHFQQRAADFTWAIQAAQDLLSGLPVYERPWQMYPLPAALFGFPFIHMNLELAGGLFYGISSGLLAFGLSRDGYHRLLIFLAFPYWSGMLTVQWLPLVMASAFFPVLLPSTMAKPQIGLPLALTHMTRKGAIACALVLLLSFALMPHWLTAWLGHLGHYAYFIPLLVLPGPLLLLALLRFRDKDAWLIVLAACMPQRWFYDAFLLWLVPRTRRAIVFTAGLSWLPAVWRWYVVPHSESTIGRWIVVACYLPMLVVVLLKSTPGLKQPSS